METLALKIGENSRLQKQVEMCMNLQVEKNIEALYSQSSHLLLMEFSKVDRELQKVVDVLEQLL